MSQENVEAVREWVAAINRGDVKTLLEIADPAVEYTPYLASLLGGDAYCGHEGLRRYVEDLKEAWDWYHVDIDELRDLGECVLMVGRLKGRGITSGLEVEEPTIGIHTFREGAGPGRYLGLRFFVTLSEALEAVGLQE
jgi:ketosteroid isomerase-like protein